jgi:hypothetical protein
MGVFTKLYEGAYRLESSLEGWLTDERGVRELLEEIEQLPEEADAVSLNGVMIDVGEVIAILDDFLRHRDYERLWNEFAGFGVPLDYDYLKENTDDYEPENDDDYGFSP